MTYRNPLSLPTIIFILNFFVTPSLYAENLDIPGTGDGISMLRVVADAFNRAYPGDTVSISPSIGSSGGVKSVGQDRAKLGRVARKIKEHEQSYGLSYFPIARVPVVFFIHRDTNITGLSASQVNDIYSGKIINWKAVGGGDNRIRVIRREDGDSSLKNLRATFPGFDQIKMTGFSKLVTTTQETFDIAMKTPGSIAFGPYTDAKMADVKLLQIDGLDPLDSNYPSYTELALIYKQKNKSGVIARFINFVMSEEGRNAIKAGYGHPVN